MSRRPTAAPVVLDPTPLSCVARCRRCEWRTITPTIGTAWAAAGRHLRATHDDIHGGRAAMHAARAAVARDQAKARKRAQSADDGTHGIPSQGA